MAEITYEEQVAARQEQVEAEIDAAKKEVLEKGYAFEELIRTKGWELIKSNYVNSVQVFATKVINNGFDSIEELNLERGKILGKQQILNDIDAALKALQDEQSTTSIT